VGLELDGGNVPVLQVPRYLVPRIGTCQFKCSHCNSWCQSEADRITCFLFNKYQFINDQTTIAAIFDIQITVVTTTGSEIVPEANILNANDWHLPVRNQTNIIKNNSKQNDDR
jgi:hypothetical protein